MTCKIAAVFSSPSSVSSKTEKHRPERGAPGNSDYRSLTRRESLRKQVIVHSKQLLASAERWPRFALAVTQRAGRSGARGGGSGHGPGWGGPAGGAFKPQSPVSGTLPAPYPPSSQLQVPATQDAVFPGSGCLVPPCLL